MKHSQALAYIRQLCCLGLNAETVIPDLLRAIQPVIPSENNVFVGLDANCKPAYVIPEIFLEEPLAVIAEEPERIFPQQAIDNLAYCSRRYRMVEDAKLIFGESFYKSDIYNLVWRPYDHHHVLHGFVRDGHTPLGVFPLCRPRTKKPFSEAEKALYSKVLPYVEHALQANPSTDTVYAANGKSGMAIVNPAGSVEFMDDTARALLALAANPMVHVGGGTPFRGNAVSQVLPHICQNLSGIFQNKAVPPPVWVHNNGRGRFVFRAYWLNRQNRDIDGMIGVTVEHQEPVLLQQLRGLRELPLSSTQREVCILLAQNHSHEAIARRLNIKPSTVKDHIRKIYGKLEIHSREDLRARISQSGMSNRDLPTGKPA